MIGGPTHLKVTLQVLREPANHSRPFQASEILPSPGYGVSGFTTSVIIDKWPELHGQQQVQE